MHCYRLEREQLIGRPRKEIFAFFSDASNLEMITPGFLNFRILTPTPIEMRQGAKIEYRIVLYGVPIKWRTVIECWTPEDQFIDEQISGPYTLWRHTHFFSDAAEGKTLMRDVVDYALPLGPVGRVIHWLFVRSSLKQIFDYRAEMTERLLGQSGDAGSDAGIDPSVFGRGNI